MTTETLNSNPGSEFDLSQPLPAGADAFTRQVHALLDGTPKEDAVVENAFAGMEGMFDIIAAGLYNLASMLVGEGEESIRLVETAVASAEVSACDNPEQARHSSRLALSRAALDLIAERDPNALAYPAGLQPVSTCIEDDDLEAAGVSRDELERMMAGPGRERVRTWLESLPAAMRTIFVLRAVAGLSAQDTASLIAARGGPGAAPWNADAVRELFRQGLCSLASQLIHAGTKE